MNVIFDFDGTLADTMRGLERAGVAVMSAFYHVPREEARLKYRATIGSPFAVQLVQSFGHSDIRAENEFEYYKRHLYRYAKPFPQAEDVLASIMAKGFRVGVVSSTSIESVKRFVERNRLPMSDICGNQTRNGAGDDKASQIRLLVKECGYELFAGDAPRDLNYAREAGIPFIGVSTTFSHEVWESSGIRHVRNLKGVQAYAGA